jgi:hypothetical protein
MSKENKTASDDLERRVATAKRLLSEALALLNGSDAAPQKGKQRAKATSSDRLSSPSFSLNIRAFMKRYASGKSGPQKFALLLARLTNGKTGVDIPGKDIEAAWKRMKGVMGAYNPAYSTRAKEQGWLNPSKYGVYSLSPSWTEVLEE